MLLYASAGISELEIPGKKKLSNIYSECHIRNVIPDI